MWTIIKKYWVWLAIGLVIIVIPICFLWLIDSTDSKTTLIYYTFEIVGGVGTLYAVIIALFSNDLQKLYHRPAIAIELTPPTLGSDTQTQGQQLQVNKYYRNICIKNGGDVQASECELYIESIKIANRIVKEDVVVKWNSNLERTYIPAGGHRTVDLLEIKPTPDYIKSDDVEPDSQVNNLRGQLWLTGMVAQGDWYNNEIAVTIAVYSISTSEPVRKTIKINYNGQWSANKEEMEQFIKIELL